MSTRILILVLWSAGAGACAPPRPPATEAVEGSVRRVAAALETPAERLALEESLRAARAADRAREHELAAILWARAANAAHAAWREHDAAARALRDRWNLARSRSGPLIERAGALAPDLQSAVATTALRTARESLERADRRAAAGDLDEAVRSAEAAAAAAGRVIAVWEKAHARFDEPGHRRLWSGWVRHAVEDSRREGVALVVDKLRRRLELWRNGRLAASYPAELGRRGLERKLRAGDRATPEGRYRVTEVREGSATRYYKALMLDYPRPEDRARLAAAIRAGAAPRGADPGSLIEVHGHGGRGTDWTDGCVALRDEDLDALWPSVRVGLSVTIVGTSP